MENVAILENQENQEKSLATFDRQAAYHTLLEAETEKTRARANYHRVRRITTSLRDDIIENYTMDGIHDSLGHEKLAEWEKKYAKVSRRNDVATEAYNNAFAYYHTSGECNTRAELIDWLIKAQAERKAYLAKEAED